MTTPYATVLTIAGSDSSGGAGIQADIKSISANGGYAAIMFDPIIAIPSVIIAYTVATRWCILYHFLGINTGCHQVEGNTEKSGRNNIIEGLSISLVLLLLLSIVYFIVKYINI